LLGHLRLCIVSSEIKGEIITIFFHDHPTGFFSIDDYVSWVTIFFTSKFGENSTIKKSLAPRFFT
jgi:hypothetical protein